MKLSIGMMVKNEEKYLERCLKSLAPILDSIESELIIVDTGSEDNSVEIAKKYTDKIYFHRWNNNFSEMRNITISYCSGEWFFYVDGDEIIKDVNNIIDLFMTNNIEKYNSGFVNIKNYTDENDLSKYSVFPAMRLFRNSESFKFQGAVHNQPLFEGPSVDLSTLVEHYGYLSTDKELMERKFKRTSTILKDELERNPNNIYYRYQLAVSYGMHKDYYLAIEEIRKAYNLLNNTNKNQHIYVLTQYALAASSVNGYDECEKICLEADKIRKGIIDIYYHLGMSQLALGKKEYAIGSFKSYIDCVEKYEEKRENEDLSIINYTLSKKELVLYELVKLISEKDMNISFKYAEKISEEIVVMKLIAELIKNNLENLDIDNIERIFYFIGHKLSDKYESFIEVLEKLIVSNNIKDEELRKIEKIFITGKDTYSLLNKIRENMYSNEYIKASRKIEELVYRLDYKSCPLYFSDVIYYKLKMKEEVESILCGLEYGRINQIIVYIENKFEDLRIVLKEYINNSDEDKSLSFLRVFIMFQRKVLLLLYDESDEQYSELFRRYIQNGIEYIKYVYNDKIIESEMINEAKDLEDAMLIYFYHALRYKGKKWKKYIEYLEKAVKVNPEMKKGIQLLLDEIIEEINKPNIEFEKLKEEFKSNIEMLISNELYNEGLELIKQYTEICGNDIEILKLKSSIYIQKCSKSTNS